MKESLGLMIEKWLMNMGMSFEIAEILSVTIILFVIALVGWLADFLTKHILLSVLQRFIKRTKTVWDDILLEKKLFNRIAHFAPALIVYYTIDIAFPDVEVLTTIIEKASLIVILLISIMVINSFLNGVNDIYDETTGKDKGTSIKSYTQVLKILFISIIVILMISVLFKIDVGGVLGGIGALTAVVLLIFKDSILGLVAGIQLSANDMVRIGDWISMPSHNADGPVMEITLNTVKIQNWDKTISTVPTYALVSESFANWRGMEESPGRRMKRSVQIDINSVHFCSDEEIQAFKKKEGVAQIIEKLLKTEKKLTNSTIFRYYLWDFIKNRADVNAEMTCMVRYLNPDSKGLPIEFYAFSNIQTWVEYEQVQANILDFAYSSMHEFNLRAYQEAAGTDIRSLRN